MKSFSTDIQAASQFDWENLSEPSPVADLAIQQALGALDGAEESIFHSRMRVLRAARKIKTWERCIDPEYGVPFTSMENWIKSTWPKSYRYAKDAWETEEALSELPMEKLAEVSGANLKVLKEVSTSVRKKPAVLKAAREMTADAFKGYLSQQHQQHIEPVRLMPKTDAAEFESSLNRVILAHECTRAEALVVVSKLINENYPMSERKAG